METLWIQRSDFLGIVNISEHCAEGDEILNQFIRESQNLDMMGLLGNCFYNEISGKLTDAEYQDLLEGSTYIVNSKDKTHFGLKRVLIHYAYAAYIYRGGMVDTPFSFVQKTSKDSIPVPTSELRNLHDENRRIARSYWDMTFDYLCNNKDLFECFDDCDCPVTDCDECGSEDCESCSGRSANKRRGFRLKVIKK